MSELGSFSNGGLGFGLNFTLRDFFSGTARNIETRMRGLETTSDKMSRGVTRAFNRIKTGIAIAGVGAAMVFALAPAVNKSMEFNAVLSAVEAKVSELDVSMSVLKNTALDLGTKTKFTATQAGEGMEFLAMTGLKATEIIQGMPGLLDLAAAGNLDLARSADIATNIMTALGMKAADLGRISDVLAKLITTSNVNMEQLGYTMKFAAPRAGQLGVSLEKLAGLSGILGDVGIQGTIAGTSLREFFTNLSRVKEKGKLGAFGKLGLGLSDIVDTNGNMKDTVVIMDKLLSKFRGLGNIEAASLATKIFGVGGDSVIAALLSKSSKNFAQYSADLENSAGTASRVANKMLDNFAGDMIKLRSIIDTTLIKIGDAVEPLLRPLAQGLAVIVGWFSKLAVNPAGRFLIQVTAILGGVLLVVGLTKIALGVATLAWTAFGAAAWAAITPLLPFIAIGAAIVAVIAGVIYLVDKATKSFNNMKTPATGFLGFLQRLGGYVSTIKAVWESWDRLTQTFTLTGEMKNKLQDLGILETALAIGTWVVRIKSFFVAIKEGFSGGMNIVRSTLSKVQPYLDKATKLFDKITLSLGMNTSELITWEKVGKAIGLVIAGIVGGIMLFTKIAIFAIQSVTTAIIYLVSKIIQAGLMVKNFVMRIITAFTNFTSPIRKAGYNLIMSFWEGAKSVLGSMVQGITDMLMKIPGFGLALKGISYIGGEVSNFWNGEDNKGNIKPVNTGSNNIASMQNDFDIAKAKTPIMLNPNFNVPQNKQPIMIQNVIEMDGEVVAKKVNEVNELNDNLQ